MLHSGAPSLHELKRWWQTTITVSGMMPKHLLAYQLWTSWDLGRTHEPVVVRFASILLGTAHVQGNCSYCRADEYNNATLLFPRIWLVRLWQLPWPLGNQPPHSAPCQPKLQPLRYIIWWEQKDRHERERREERPEVVLGPGGRWKSWAWYAMHNPSNSPWREFCKWIALKEHLWCSEGIVKANCDKDKSHDRKCSDYPYLYISLQEWAAGRTMKCRVNKILE